MKLEIMEFAYYKEVVHGQISVLEDLINCLDEWCMPENADQL